jgi:hypothetical protein
MPKLAAPIEIFYPGHHVASDGRKISFSKEQVASWANAGPIPLVPGHPSDDQPVMGWATKIGFDGKKLQVLEVEDVSPDFQAIVNSGQLNRVSVKLAPTGKNWELKHIGFLGKSPPALSNLKAAKFSANTGEVWIMGDEDEKELEFAARELELAEREAEFSAKMAKFEAEAKWKPVVAEFARSGQVLPTEEAPLVALFCQLDQAAPIEFSQAGEEITRKPAEFLQALLTRTKPAVTYREVGSDTPKTGGDGAAFMARPGVQVDEESEELHSKAVAYCKENGMNPKKSGDYLRAVEAVSK